MLDFSGTQEELTKKKIIKYNQHAFRKFQPSPLRTLPPVFEKATLRTSTREKKENFSLNFFSFELVSLLLCLGLYMLLKIFQLLLDFTFFARLQMSSLAQAIVMENFSSKYIGSHKFMTELLYGCFYWLPERAELKITSFNVYVYKSSWDTIQPI